MTMSILEMKKTLKQLRLSGVLATLETRLLEAQTSNLSARNFHEIFFDHRCKPFPRMPD
jgi:hypothetical protein